MTRQRVKGKDNQTPASGNFGNKNFWTQKRFPRLRIRDSKDAIRWFRSKVDSIESPNRKPVEGRRGKRRIHQNPLVGHLYLYKYEAKWDRILPTWDRFPLCLVINKYADGFLGINFHYLPLPQRYSLMAALFKTMKPASNIWEYEKLDVTYGILQAVAQSKLYEPCVKRYLYSQMRSPWSVVDLDEAKMALAMPLQSFVRGRPY
jgi:hypothetical protein